MLPKANAHIVTHAHKLFKNSNSRDKTCIYLCHYIVQNGIHLKYRFEYCYDFSKKLPRFFEFYSVIAIESMNFQIISTVVKVIDI